MIIFLILFQTSVLILVVFYIKGFKLYELLVLAFFLVNFIGFVSFSFLVDLDNNFHNILDFLGALVIFINCLICLGYLILLFVIVFLADEIEASRRSSSSSSVPASDFVSVSLFNDVVNG